MKQKIVGDFFCGFKCVQLVLREGQGGEFYSCPEKGSVPRLKIGADYDKWCDLVAVLLHELEEYLLFDMGARFHPTDKVNYEHTAYKFMFDHTQFTEFCCRQADFLTACLPPLSSQWAAWKRSAKSRTAK